MMMIWFQTFDFNSDFYAWNIVMPYAIHILMCMPIELNKCETSDVQHRNTIGSLEQYKGAKVWDCEAVGAVKRSR